MEQKFRRRTKVPFSESSRELIGQGILELLLQGANWPGSEEAVIPVNFSGEAS